MSVAVAVTVGLTLGVAVDVRVGVTVAVIVFVPDTPVREVNDEFCTCETLAASVATVPAPRPVILKFESGMLAVTVCVPSFKRQVESPVAISERVLFAQVEEIVVPVTTGFPEARLNTPELKLMSYLPAKK